MSSRVIADDPERLPEVARHRRRAAAEDRRRRSAASATCASWSCSSMPTASPPPAPPASSTPTAPRRWSASSATPGRWRCDVKGIGFRSADELARQMGRSAARRRNGWRRPACTSSTRHGHGAMPAWRQAEACQRLQGITGCTARSAAAAVETMTRSGHIAVEPHDPEPVAMLAALQAAEVTIAEAAARLARGGAAVAGARLRGRATADAELALGLSLAPASARLWPPCWRPRSWW